MLAERFKELEEEGMISRNVYPETPVRVEYQLTDKGKTLMPMMVECEKWAENWIQ
jgi:DNA-binding HxlR family transcriptional regulator